MTEYKQINAAYERLPQFQGTRIVPQKSPLVFQYRNFQSFWQILESDSFWATNARFSNDDEEQKFGRKVIASLCNNELDSKELGLDENYIICFCREDDKLSQWRGYAPEGGVAMGFDFSMPRAFSVLNAETNSTDILSRDNCVIQYVGLDAVKYLEPREKREDILTYGEYCREQLDLVNPASYEEELDVYCDEIRKKAPYVKHSGFIEEDECRLVFHDDKGELDKCIRYRNADSTTLRYPYIVVKAALPRAKVRRCGVRVCIQDDKELIIVKELRKLLKGDVQLNDIQGCHLFSGTSCDLKEPFCTGCVLRHLESLYDSHLCRYSKNFHDMDYGYTVPSDENCIIITQGKNQEAIFEKVHEYIEKINKDDSSKIAIWCEGHLPLRKITIGPCNNQNSVVEAVRHFCKHTYWLRYVQIEVSAIPFRKSL